MASREYDWFLRADMQRYRGKYVIIKGRKVVLSGKNPKQLIATFKRKYPRETPTITKVPRRSPHLRDLTLPTVAIG